MRIAVSIESGAATVLDELVTQLYPSKRANQARALVIEMAVRALHRQVMGTAGADALDHSHEAP